MFMASNWTDGPRLVVSKRRAPSRSQVPQTRTGGSALAMVGPIQACLPGEEWAVFD